MTLRIAALAAIFLAAFAIPFAVAASQPPQLTVAETTAFATLVVDPYAAKPMQVSLVGGFSTLDEMM